MAADDTCDLLCLDLPHAEQIRAALPGLSRLEPAADTYRSLGDPTRLRVAAALLADHELCVCDTAWIVGASQGLVSHHLRQLRAAGVVSSRRDGRMVMYRLSERGRAVLSVLFTADDTTDGVTDDRVEGANRV